MNGKIKITEEEILKKYKELGNLHLSLLIEANLTTLDKDGLVKTLDHTMGFFPISLPHPLGSLVTTGGDQVGFDIQKLEELISVAKYFNVKYVVVSTHKENPLFIRTELGWFALVPAVSPLLDIETTSITSRDD